MPKEDWQENHVQKLFSDRGLWPSREKVRTVLDVACGLSLKSKYIDCDLRLGVDIHVPYLERIESDVPYAVIVGDATKLRETFLAKSFDVVLLLDIIEHVEKSQSHQLLRDAEEIARVAVVIETPNGFLPQNVDILGCGGDHWQTHRCGWTAPELKALGYHVFTRPYKLSPVKRHTDEQIALECDLLNAIKRLDI